MFYWGSAIPGNGEYPWRVRGKKNEAGKKGKQTQESALPSWQQLYREVKLVTQSLILSVSPLLNTVFSLVKS